MELHQHEKLILDFLKQMKAKNKLKVNFDDFLELGLNRDAISRALILLSEKGLAKYFREQTSKSYILGKEGEKYVDSGLPEESLISHGTSFTINDLSEIEKKIGLQWAKRKGWIKIDGANIMLTENGKTAAKNMSGKKMLQKLQNKQQVGEKELLELEGRGDIVKSIINYTEWAEITPAGEKTSYSLGEEVNVLTKDLIVGGGWKNITIRPYNLSFPVEKKFPGKLHPYLSLLDQTKDKLLALGFEEMTGPAIEMNFWNCDALFMPSDHPARGIHDVFYVWEPKEGNIENEVVWEKVRKTHETGGDTGSRGWGKWDPKLAKRMILRSQTTAVSARTLSKLKKEDLPRKFFTIDHVYRPDVVDARHLPEFLQCEGIVVAEDVNLRHLMGFMKFFAESFGIKDVKFQPAFFPFTEPSIVGYIKHPKLGWIEAMPGGIFRPEVTKPLGIDVPVLAWGLGIDRLAMVALGIDDIRMLFSDNLQWLRESNIPLLQ